MRKILFPLLALISIVHLEAQITGVVTDEKGHPLPFVNIYLENAAGGTTTNGEGIYALDVIESGTTEYTVVFQFLGFSTLTKTVDITTTTYELNVVMKEQTTSLDEVVVEAGVNPADRIIRQTIDQRKRQLEKIGEYTASFYSRGLWRVKDAPEKILGREVGDLGGGLDSTRSGIIYLSETVSNIAYRRPNDFSEKITASKVSGDDNGFSFNTAVDANFSFYENTIDLNTKIISPIASNAFSYYKYKLIGTFYESGKLINQIEVIPRRPKDRVFSGTIYVVEEDWQLYGVALRTNGQAIQVPVVKELEFKQNFTYDPTYDLWVKRLQTIDFSFGFLGFKGNGRFTAQYSNYDFDPKFEKRSFSNEILSFAAEANKKDSTFWNTIRPVPLTTKELEDYVLKDSIQVVRKSKKYLDSIDSRSNRLELVSPLLGYTYTNSYKRYNIGYDGLAQNSGFNTVQGWNVSTGIYYGRWSDEDFKKTFYAFAKANYGFSDDRLRFTFGFNRRFNRTNRATIGARGGVVAQAFNPEDVSTTQNSIGSLFRERNYLKLYERRFVQSYYNQELWNGFRLYTYLSYEDRRPLFNTTDQTWYPQSNTEYTSNNPLDPADFVNGAITKQSIWKAQVTAQINFDQKYYSYPSGKFTYEDDRYPTLYVTYEKGFAGSREALNFDQLRVALRQGFNIGNKGRFDYNFKAGTFLSDTDGLSFVDFQHFNGNETVLAFDGSYVNRFNMLPYYSRSTNDSYVELHAEHNFQGWVLGKIPLVNQLNFNLVAGGHLLSTVDGKPYYEYSIGLDNIGWGSVRFLRVDYVRSLGAGNTGGFVFGIKIPN